MDTTFSFSSFTRKSWSLLILFCMSASALQANTMYVSDPYSSTKKNTFTLTTINGRKELDKVDPKTHLLWYRNSVQQRKDEQHFFLFNEIIAKGKTPYQSYAFIKTKLYGNVLFIDGEVQSSEKDEYIYHESLVHPAMVAHPCPKSVLIIGAGEGAAAREVLRHPSVEHITLVDIDGEIIQKCKEILTPWHQGSFDHPKSELLIVDGKKYIENTKQKYDVIFIDICDNLDDSPVVALYTKDFYRSIKNVLNPNGIVVVQAMEFTEVVNADHIAVHHNLQKAFSSTASYNEYIPSFLSTWGFVIAADNQAQLQLSTTEIDSILKERGIDAHLKHYDGTTHNHMFSLPKALRRALKEAK
jgi:spermidine synthase